MEIERNGRIVVRFGRFKKLIIDPENLFIQYWGGKIFFYQVMGYWKNYRRKGGDMVYYVVLLTKERMHRITPEMDEASVEKVLNLLKDTIPVEAKS